MPAMIPVNSTNLMSVGYDAQTQELFIRFRNGSLYVYANVPQHVYEGLMSAPSHGQYHAAHIKNAFRYKRLS